jgi:hypothetical protein
VSVGGSNEIWFTTLNSTPRDARGSPISGPISTGLLYLRLRRSYRPARLLAGMRHIRVESGKIGLGATLSKELARAHRRQLLGESRRDELIHADAVLLRALLDLLLEIGGRRSG